MYPLILLNCVFPNNLPISFSIYDQNNFLYLHGHQCFLDLVNRFVWFILHRSSWDGGSHDVHHSVSDDSYCWPQRLEASVLGLWLVICVGGCCLEREYKPALFRRAENTFCLQIIVKYFYSVVST